jgi:hypothetical protein
VGYGKSQARLYRLANLHQRLVAMGATPPEEQGAAKRHKANSTNNNQGNKGNNPKPKPKGAVEKGPNWCDVCNRNTKSHNTATHRGDFKPKPRK